MRNEIGIFYWYGYFQPLRIRLEEIKGSGFDGVMLWWEDEMGEEPEKIGRIPAVVRESGLKIFNVHMAGLDSDELWQPSQSRRQDYVRRVCQTIEEMADADLHQLVMHLCERGDIPDPPKELLYSMEEILPYAEANRTVLAIENTWRDDYLDRVFQEFPSKEVGFCYDTSHAQLRSHQGLLDRWGRLLCADHISDNDRVEDRHWLPFDGEIDFDPLLLRMAPADMPYTLEVIANKELYPESAGFLQTAYERALRLQERVQKLES